MNYDSLLDSSVDDAGGNQALLSQIDKTFVRYIFALKCVLMCSKSVSDFLQILVTVCQMLLQSLSRFS